MFDTENCSRIFREMYHTYIVSNLTYEFIKDPFLNQRALRMLGYWRSIGSCFVLESLKHMYSNQFIIFSGSVAFLKIVCNSFILLLITTACQFEWAFLFGTLIAVRPQFAHTLGSQFCLIQPSCVCPKSLQNVKYTEYSCCFIL